MSYQRKATSSKHRKILIQIRNICLLCSNQKIITHSHLTLFSQLTKSGKYHMLIVLKQVLFCAVAKLFFLRVMKQK